MFSRLFERIAVFLFDNNGIYVYSMILLYYLCGFFKINNSYISFYEDI